MIEEKRIEKKFEGAVRLPAVLGAEPEQGEAPPAHRDVDNRGSAGQDASAEQPAAHQQILLRIACHDTAAEARVNIERRAVDDERSDLLGQAERQWLVRIDAEPENRPRHEERRLTLPGSDVA